MKLSNLPNVRFLNLYKKIIYRSIYYTYFKQFQKFIKYSDNNFVRY